MVLFEHHLWSSGFQVIEIAKRFQVLVMVPEHLTRIQQNWGLRGPLEEKKQPFGAAYHVSRPSPRLSAQHYLYHSRHFVVCCEHLIIPS